MSPEKGPFQKENSLPTIIFQGESLLVFGGGIYKHVPLKEKLYFDVNFLAEMTVFKLLSATSQSITSWSRHPAKNA